MGWAMGLNRRRNQGFGAGLRTVFEQSTHTIKRGQMQQPIGCALDLQLLAQAQADSAQLQQNRKCRGIEFLQSLRVQYQVLRARRHTGRQQLQAGPSLGMGEDGR
jgi:hypothetical protein